MFELSLALQLLLLVAAAASVLCNPSTHTLSACLNLHGITNFTTSSGDPSYSWLLDFSIQNLRFAGPATPKPAAILLPRTARELAKSVACSRAGGWEMRVRGGGHSYEGTSFTSNDRAPFVVIDLMNLDRVRVDLGSETAWVEGGATLGQTYYAIAQASPVHVFPAGNCHTVGIGGHISAGGFGRLSRKFGLAADNVVDALLVTADGKLLDKKSMGEDVFWAIRGGGGGIWGIVFAWKIKLRRIPETVTTCTLHRPGNVKQVAELVRRWQLVAPKLQEDLALSCKMSSSYVEPDSGVRARFDVYFLGERYDLLSTLNLKFPELGIQENDCHEMSWIKAAVYFSGLSHDREATPADLANRYARDKRFFWAKSDYAAAMIPQQGFETALEYLDKEPKGLVKMHPYGGAMDRISSDAIAFPHRRGTLFSIEYLVLWKEEDDWRSDKFLEWIREFHGAMSPYMSKAPRPAYVGSQDFDLGVMPNLSRWSSRCQENGVELARAWGERYFLGNYERLVRVKTQIDPYDVFRHEQGVHPICSTK